MENGRLAFGGGGGLVETYDVHLKIIGKRIVDSLLVFVNWTFIARCYGWGTTSEYQFQV